LIVHCADNDQLNIRRPQRPPNHIESAEAGSVQIILPLAFDGCNYELESFPGPLHLRKQVPIGTVREKVIAENELDGSFR
jgi:hypothetical protein